MYSSGAAVLFPLCEMGFPRGLCIFAVGAVEQGPAWNPGRRPGLPGFHSPVPSVSAATVVWLSPWCATLSLGCHSGLLTMMACSYLVGGGGVEIDNTVGTKKCSLNESKVLPQQLVLVMLGRGCADSRARALQESKQPCQKRPGNTCHLWFPPLIIPLCPERGVFVP